VKWRGVEIDKLDNATLIDALRQALTIVGQLWHEVMKRKLVRDV